MCRLPGEPGEVVPCRLVYTPHNWLLDPSGQIVVIDFEWSAEHVWLADLARLHLGWRSGRRGLRKAFLAGYRRPLTEEDAAPLYSCAAVIAGREPTGRRPPESWLAGGQGLRAGSGGLCG